MTRNLPTYKKSGKQLLYILFLIYLGSWYKHVNAQEQAFLDNSSKEVHGIHTTFFITPADLKFNRKGISPVSLAISRIDQFTYRQKISYKLQDLGNEGTASKQVFYHVPTEIGFDIGFHAYDIYFKNPLYQKYYDTKAPYTDGTVIFANYGSYAFEATHARSINKNWHMGFIFESMLTDREFIPSKIPYDRQIITTPFRLFGRYLTDNEKYQILVSFYRKNHRQRDTGGISSRKNKLLRDWLKPKAEIQNNLPASDSIENSELRIEYFVYHQLHVTDPLQIYHEAILTNRFNNFQAEELSKKSIKFLRDTSKQSIKSINDSTVCQSFSNEWGVKGETKHIFYQYYYKNKSIKVHPTGKPGSKNIREDYLGIYTRTKLGNNKNLLHVSGEYLQGNYYKIHAGYQGAWAELSYDQVKYKPSYLTHRHRSIYRTWANRFSPPLVKHIEGALLLPLDFIFLKPYIKLTNVYRPIYFRKKPHKKAINVASEPIQGADYANIQTLGSIINISLWDAFHIDTEVISTTVTGPSAALFRIPEWHSNVRSYYAKSYYEDNAAIETGIEFNWKSDYKADGYDPATQQFFIQDNFSLYAYPVLELFFNFRIKTFRGFIKAIHVNQGLPVEGYFITPFYPAQLRSIDLGVSWTLFD